VAKSRNEFVRVKLQYLSDPNDDPLMFDLKIDEDRRPMGKWPIFGLCGDIKGDPSDLYPIVLHEDGLVNFGSETESRYRFWETNLRKCRIVKGERVIFRSDPGDGRVKQEEWAYQIASVAVVGDREI